MIISIMNQKGGVAKTTTAVTLAHGLTLLSYKVLLIDLDPQGNCSDGLGIDPGMDLYRMLIDERPLTDVAYPARPNLDLVRSDRTTVAARQILSGRDFREMVIADALRGHQYDVVIIDCAPSLDVLQTAAMVASDYMIIPTLMSQFSVKGIYDAEKSLLSVRRAAASTCQIIGILPTLYDRRENIDQLAVLVEDFKHMIWPVIPVDARVKSCHRRGQTLYEYAPSSPALIGYRQGSARIGGYQATVNKIMELL